MASSKKSTSKKDVATVETETPSAVQDTPQPSKNGTAAQRSKPTLYPVEMIDIDKITMPDNVRADWERLDVLEVSIVTNSLINPIVVRRYKDGYRLLDGHNRLEAAKNLGWTQVPAQIREYDDNDLRQELVTLEANLVRDELRVLEYAEALGRQREIYVKLHPKTEHGKGRMQQDPTNGSHKSQRPAFIDEKASQLGWSRSKVGNHMYLYKHLPLEVRDLIRTHEIADNFTALDDLAREDADIQLRVARLLHDEPQMLYEDALRQAAPQVVEEREEREWDKQRHPGKGEQDDMQDDLIDLHEEELEDKMMASNSRFAPNIPIRAMSEGSLGTI